jgi:hypothetical protein
MTAGAYQHHLSLADTPGVTADWTGVHPRDSVRAGLYPTPPSVGSFTRNRPFAIRSLALTGARNVWAFFDDFYFRFWFIPKFIDFGLVTSTIFKDVKIWNAYLTNIDLNAITGTGDTSIVIDGPEVPFTFIGLAVNTYSIVALPEGPLTINTDYRFDFANGDSLHLPVTGARARLWQFPIDWGHGFQITYDYKTEIITSRFKREQRIANRTTARKSFEFTIHAAFSKLRELNDLMALWGSRPFVVPELPRRAKLAAQMDASANVCTVEYAPVWLVVDRNVVLIHGEQRETRHVSGVAGATITFSDNTTTVWPAGTNIHPALSANLANELTSKRHTNRVAEMGARFEIVPAFEVAEAVGMSEATFNGREVFNKRWNWADDVSLTYAHFLERLDYGRGRIATYTPAPFNTKTFKATFLNQSREEAETLLQFFGRMKGQRGEFYRATFEPDIVPKTTAPFASKYLRIAGWDFYDAYDGDTVHQAMHVRMNNGEECFARIKEMTTLDDELGKDTQIEIFDTWPFEIAPANTLMVSWLLVWRLGSDTAVFEWLTDSVCKVTLAFKTLEALVVDV